MIALPLRMCVRVCVCVCVCVCARARAYVCMYVYKHLCVYVVCTRMYVLYIAHARKQVHIMAQASHRGSSGSIPGQSIYGEHSGTRPSFSPRT